MVITVMSIIYAGLKFIVVSVSLTLFLMLSPIYHKLQYWFIVLIVVGVAYETKPSKIQPQFSQTTMGQYWSKLKAFRLT